MCGTVRVVTRDGRGREGDTHVMAADGDVIVCAEYRRRSSHRRARLRTHMRVNCGNTPQSLIQIYSPRGAGCASLRWLRWQQGGVTGEQRGRGDVLQEGWGRAFLAILSATVPTWSNRCCPP